MKPIIMVIVGSAMLIPAMHRITYVRPVNMPETRTVHQRPTVEIPKQKPDSEVLIRDLSFWIERLP